MTTDWPAFQSAFLKTLTERQYVHQITDAEGLDGCLRSGVQSAYIGFDCTAPSLHVGNLVSIMMLRHFQKAGHRPIVLLGGGTTKVGDPSGKDKSRQMLDEGSIASNMASIRRVFERFLSFGDGPSDAILVNNADWLDGLSYIDFLRDIGPHFTVNRMLTFDSVQLRLEREQPLSFIEFNYMILQAYDFLELSRRANCSLQMGGSDQWGNIVNGMELCRRHAGKQVFGLTTPLITTADGGKMGKTADGAVWLNADALTPYDYWQFWRNTQDADVGRFLRLFTELPIEEIERLEALEGQEINDAKIILANAATALCHGPEAQANAARTAEQTFAQRGQGDNLPEVILSKAETEAGLTLVDLLLKAEFAKSKGEARRLIAQGGARIENEKITDIEFQISDDDLREKGSLKLSSGKKKHARIVVR
ncbi:MAG: tyrosine--tRNA ligase [Pseudomonadota bacterium]